MTRRHNIIAILSFVNVLFSTMTFVKNFLATALDMDNSVPQCSHLLPGQYLCDLPEINPFTQQPFGCTPQNVAFVNCTLSPNTLCEPLNGNNTFSKEIPCFFSSGKSWRIALGLSVFFGWLGLDRFYLGYYCMGLLKLTTFGFFFIFHLIDVILVALQIVGPADGTSYFIDYYGSRMTHLYYNSSSVEYL